MIYADQGVKKVQQGKYTEGIEILNQSLGLDNQQGDLNYELARAYYFLHVE